MIGCEGCCHNDCCGYFSELNTYDISIPEEEQKAFEEFCCGCSCGEGIECNRDQGCDNYETEPIKDERVEHMYEIDILRFRCDYEVILTHIKKILEKHKCKIFDEIFFKIEKTTEGEKIVVFGYDSKYKITCRYIINCEELKAVLSNE